MYLEFGNIQGLPDYEREKIRELEKVFNYHFSKNLEKDKYYEGHIPLSEVNLGIALPKSMKNLEVGCEWGSKAVDVLAARSMFDGFVKSNGYPADEMNRISNDNNLLTEYMKACRDELKYGCTFATLSKDPVKGCKIRFHSPASAAALWNGEKGRIDCGLAIIDTKKDESDINYKPSLINFYTDDAVYVLRNSEKNAWTAVKYPNKMGRPLMEALVWNATTSKPFGRSRIKESIRRLIQGYVRTVANATVALEFATSPQKYILGVTDEQFDAINNEKFNQYIGSILAATTNPETGSNPVFGQLSQGTLSPHVEMLRLLATQFSAATGLSSTDTGVISEANPSSSDAIIAQTQTLITLAEQLNASNGEALKRIALMAQAVAKNETLSELDDEERSIVAHFKNPAMPSVSSTADAAVKIASARPAFANTDIYLEMVGFDIADVRRIKSQETRQRGLALADELDAQAEAVPEPGDEE